MSKVAILGATGSLGRQVVQQAIAARHDVTAIVRTPSRVAAELRDKVSICQCDLGQGGTRGLSDVLRGHDAIINTAGHVTDGQAFVELVDHVVSSLETVADANRPACWFLGGAGVLDIDDSGRRGVDLPRVGSIYWPHRANFERLTRSRLDWRLLCPGPMVEQAPLGAKNLRTSLDRLPVSVPTFARSLPGILVLPVFAYLIPEMIVSYADAASLMLGNLDREGGMSRHRVGMALPRGMRGRKTRWVARPKDAGRSPAQPERRSA